MKSLLVIFMLLAQFALFVPSSRAAADASISFSPSAGQFAIGSTLEVSVVINTGSQAINAVDVGVSFPADKLQVISPSVGTSFISIWTAQPSYSNTAGTLKFSGGLPNPGIKSSAAILATIQFRIKSSGSALLEFSSTTKVLANDGDGTNVLSSKTRAVFGLKTAPPEGPVVVSSTHPDSNTWYNDRTASFSWEALDRTDGYSYLFNNASKTVPKEQITDADTSTTITAETDGNWYFHIRAVADGAWGGTTHFPVRIDTTAPAQFTPKLDRSVISVGERAIISFFTTDAASGLDHFEIKVLNIRENNAAVSLFHEESSPYQFSMLPAGKYKVIVRAYDVAGNYTDGESDLTVANSALAFFGNLGWPGYLAISIGLILLLMLSLALRRRRTQTAPVAVPQGLGVQSPNTGQNFPTQ